MMLRLQLLAWLALSICLVHSTQTKRDFFVKSQYLVCPTGWQRFANFCYLFSDRKTTWLQAKNECNNYGGYLAEPYNKNIDEFISGYSIDKNVKYWIGLSDRLSEGNFVWEQSNEPVTESNWIPGDPNNANGNEDCVLTNWYKQWADAPCDWQQNYVCQIKPRCAPGWEKRDRYCFWFSDTQKTWQEAKTSCEEMGAVLAEPKDGVVDNYISGDAIQKGVRYWIGLNDIYDEGNFAWQSTSEPVGYSNWYPGDPNNASGRNEDCVLTNWYKKWADAPCSWKENYACQGKLCK